MMHIFPIKKGRGSFEKSQQYHCIYASNWTALYVLLLLTSNEILKNHYNAIMNFAKG